MPPTGWCTLAHTSTPIVQTDQCLACRLHVNPRSPTKSMARMPAAAATWRLLLWWKGTLLGEGAAVYSWLPPQGVTPGVTRVVTRCVTRSPAVPATAPPAPAASLTPAAAGRSAAAQCLGRWGVRGGPPPSRPWPGPHRPTAEAAAHPASVSVAAPLPVFFVEAGEGVAALSVTWPTTEHHPSPKHKHWIPSLQAWRCGAIH